MLFLRFLAHTIFCQGTIGSLDHFIKYLKECILYSAGRMDRRQHQNVRINGGVIQSIPCTPGKFPEEHALRSSVSFSEWMKVIDTGVKVGRFLNERLSVQSLEVIHFACTGEHSICK